MTAEEEACNEALRRIRQAENTETTSLDLSNLDFLTRLPRRLERLTALKELDLSGCPQLRNVRPLAKLRSLQVLKLSGNPWLRGNVGHLAQLRSLQVLDLSRCQQVGTLWSFAKLRSLQVLKLSGNPWLMGSLGPLAELRSLQVLDLSGCSKLNLNSRSEPSSFQTLSPLGGLASLQCLDLSGVQASHRASEFAGRAKVNPSAQALRVPLVNGGFKTFGRAEIASMARPLRVQRARGQRAGGRPQRVGQPYIAPSARPL